MKRVKKFTFIFAFFFLFFFLFYWATTVVFKISVVELHVDKSLETKTSYQKNKKAILKYLNGYKGKPLWRVNLKTLITDINTKYLVAEIHGRRKFPDRLIVFLKKKQAVVLLLKEDKFYSLSFDGEVEERLPEESFDFPILRGKVFWDSMYWRKQILLILSSIPKQDMLFSVNSISEIFYNKANNSFLFYLFPRGFVLELKKPLSVKNIKHINFVLNCLHKNGHQKGLIDARQDKRIIVKNLKPVPAAQTHWPSICA